MSLKKDLDNGTGKVNFKTLLGCYASCFVYSPIVQNKGKCALVPRMRYDVNGTAYNPRTHFPDYVRSRELELLVEIIKRKNVSGSLAEVGVYKGHFSAQINSLLPDRKIYLFDTFEGFIEDDKSSEVKHGTISSRDFVDKAFKDTNIELVLNKMKTPENCIIRQGWFPETAKGIEDIFALVSLDCDLYDPMYAGIEYFYPRLSHGGYMMLHEFNCPGFRGVKEAVYDYEEKYGLLNKIPLPDMGGTLVITK